jgi:hypothetical protein
MQTFISKRFVSVIKTKCLTPLKETDLFLYIEPCETHAHIYFLRADFTVYFDSRASGIYCNHCALKG